MKTRRDATFLSNDIGWHHTTAIWIDEKFPGHEGTGNEQRSLTKPFTSLKHLILFVGRVTEIRTRAQARLISRLSTCTPHHGCPPPTTTPVGRTCNSTAAGNSRSKLKKLRWRVIVKLYPRSLGVWGCGER